MTTPAYQTPDHRPNVEEAAMPVPATSPASPAPAVAKAMRIEGVEGAGLGHDKDGKDVLIVYLRDARAKGHLPSHIDGIRLQTEATGTVMAR